MMANSAKRILLRLLPWRLVQVIAGLKFSLSGENLLLRRRILNNERHLRMLSKRMLQQYAHLSAAPRVQSLNDYEAAVYSQNGEDGILLHLFSFIGCHNYRFVEFGVGDGVQCNTANLSLNFGWRGLLLEADGAKALKAQQYYRRMLGPDGNVKVRQTRVTTDNINRILEEENIQGEIDLLSIDIDGNDYWVWQAISSIQPRVAILEYNASLGPRRAIVVEYLEEIDARARHPSGFYHGASLTALEKLGREKGYVLVGCESAGVNAFFVRQELVTDKLQPLTPEEAYFPHYFRTRHMTVDEQWQRVAAMPFHEV